MSDFIHEKRHLWEVLLFLFNIKNTSAESCRIPLEAYVHNAPSESICRQWFRKLKDHNFDLEDKEREGAPKKLKASIW